MDEEIRREKKRERWRKKWRRKREETMDGGEKCGKVEEKRRRGKR